MTINFVTSNNFKVKQAQEAMKEFEITVRQVELDLPESRSFIPEEIAKEKAVYAYNILREPLMVEDGGLFIEALGGFPMTYVRFCMQTIGIENVLKMLKDEKNRKAAWKMAVAYVDDKSIKTFIYNNEGQIATEVRPVNRKIKSDFWKIFIPNESNPNQLASSEMADEYADKWDDYFRKYNHFKDLGEWLKNN